MTSRNIFRNDETGRRSERGRDRDSVIETFNFGDFGFTNFRGVASFDAGFHVVEPILVATAARVDEPFTVARPCVVVPHTMSLVAVTQLSGHIAKLDFCNSCILLNIDQVA